VNNQGGNGDISLRAVVIIALAMAGGTLAFHSAAWATAITVGIAVVLLLTQIQ
jgi:low affinity Fe/Cu permease